MVKEKVKVYKVNATIDDDINLIVDTIQKVESQMIMLVLPEGNDLMNSPVGLKTLKRKALSMHKALIVVAPSKQYEKLAEDAGLITTTSQDDVDASLWEKSLAEIEDFKQAHAGLNSAKNTVQKTSEVIPPAAGKKIFEDEPKEKEEKVEKTEQKLPEVIHGPVKEKQFEYAVTSVQAQAADSQTEDRPVVGPVKQQGTAMIGVDFSKVVSKGSPSLGEKLGSIFKKKEMTKDEDENLPQIIKPQYEVTKPEISGKKTVARAAGIIALGILIFAIAAFGIFYMYYPKLRIEIKVTSDKIELTDKYTATKAVTGFDASKRQFELAKESATQKGSVNITATGDGKDGTKATGNITLSQSTGLTQVDVPAGTAVKSPGGFRFITQNAVSIPPLGAGSVSVVAADFGEEYNLSPTSGYTVEGYPSLSGANGSAFTGGTKRTFKVLSQKDVDDATNQLKKDLFEQLKSELQFKNQNNGYEYIADSFIAKVEGTPVANPAIGTETTQAFLEMDTSATAYYYHKESFQKMVEKFTADQYRQNKNLDANTDVMVDSPKIDITKVTVLSKEDKVVFDFKSTGQVTPRINVDQLKKDVSGKKWDEMLTKLSSINTLASTPTTTFYPTWMPDFLRYVPKEETRIDISVKVE